MDTKHLWEADHSYYCNLGNYFATARDPCHEEYDSWADFVECEGNSDMDYNLLFRWDWKEEDEEGESTTDGTGTLYLFWMGQRKGLYRWSEVKVHRGDEPAIREWLLPRMEHLLSLWEPLNINQEEPK